MRYCRLPKTDLCASVICMGGGPLSVEDNRDRVFELLDIYYALGGNFIDSANIYGKWLPSGRNVCDENIGAWLKSRGVRDKVIVTSKGGHPHLATMSESRLSKTDVAQDLEESLRALNCDVIDMYYLHRDDENIPVEEIVNYLNDFVSAGKIRYFGASNWRLGRLQAAQRYAEASGLHGFTANQVMWSYPEFNMEASDFPGLVWLDEPSQQYHANQQLTVVAYQSQAKGFFNKYANREKTPISSTMWAQFGNPENISKYERAVKLAQQIGVGLTAIVLAYVLNQPFPSIAVIGSHTESQIHESVAAADIMLTKEQITYLDV